MDIQDFIILIIIVFVSLILFIIYFYAKIAQFVINAISLYKKIVNRQDAIIKILMDIRDNTKNFEINIPHLEEEDSFICENCKTNVPVNSQTCPNCGVEFE